MKLIIINGPNLNLLGKREREIYGTETFEAYFKQLKKNKYFIDSKVELEYFQSNVEGEIINKLHEVGFNRVQSSEFKIKNSKSKILNRKSYDGIIINPGGYSHTSVAIADAIAGIETPVVEVHITNIFARENYRHQLITASKCKAIIAGFGLDSYRLAIEYFIKMR